MLGLWERRRLIELRGRTPALAATARPAGRLINRLLAPAGLRVTRNTPASAPYDLRAVTDDPIEGAYHARDRSFVIDVALPSCRGLDVMAFKLTLESKHPHIETLLAYRRGDCRSYRDSPLRSFREEAWPLASAAEALGLDPEQTHPALRNAPASGAVMPWVAKDPYTWSSLGIKSTETDYRQHGAGLRPWALTTWDNIYELDFDRLTCVYESLRRDGYRRADHPDGDISGYILCFKGVSRFVLSGGQHRSAALAALGYQRAPIRLSPVVVRRDDVASWPNVRSGLFTQEQALEVFDRIFEGRQPRAYHWPPSTD